MSPTGVAGELIRKVWHVIASHPVIAVVILVIVIALIGSRRKT